MHIPIHVLLTLGAIVARFTDVIILLLFSLSIIGLSVVWHMDGRPQRENFSPSNTITP